MAISCFLTKEDQCDDRCLAATDQGFLSAPVGSADGRIDQLEAEGMKGAPTEGQDLPAGGTGGGQGGLDFGWLPAPGNLTIAGRDSDRPLIPAKIRAVQGVRY